MRVARSDRYWVVRLEDGESFFASLGSLGLDAGSFVSGIGMLRDVRLAYWNGREYVVHAVEGPAELLSIQGNVSVKEGEPFVHCHVVLGHEDGSVEGGHLMDGTVNETNEIVVRELLGVRMGREPEPSGLHGLYPEEA